MNEHTQRLGQSLERLKLELLNLRPQDAETQSRIDALLEKLNDPACLAETEEDHASVQELLEDSVTYFEVSHPTVTAVINQVMSLLSSIGI